MIVTVAEAAYRVFCLHKACSEMGTMVAALSIVLRLGQRVRKVVETCRYKRQQLFEGEF